MAAGAVPAVQEAAGLNQTLPASVSSPGLSPAFPRRSHLRQRLATDTTSNMTGETRTADAELVARLRAGDLAAFEDLHRQHATRLFNLAWRMLGDRTDAEDAIQEVFLQAFRKVAGFKGDATLGTWLYRLTVNLCIDRLRGRANKEGQRTQSLDTTNAWPAPTRSSVELSVDRLDLERAIAELPEGCRAAFLLHDVEGYDHREVGRILGISDGTSKSQVHKARLRIRAFLGQWREVSDPTSVDGER